MATRKKFNTSRKQFEALDDIDCFMATFYTLERGWDIDSLAGGNSTEVIRRFDWCGSIEGYAHWRRVHNHLIKIVLE